jgi:hypothetical protein
VLERRRHVIVLRCVAVGRLISFQLVVHDFHSSLDHLTLLGAECSARSISPRFGEVLESAKLLVEPIYFLDCQNPFSTVQLVDHKLTLVK